MPDEKDKAIVDEAIERLAEADDNDFRQKFVDDLKFVYEDDGQWDDKVKADRIDRPCYTFNRTEGAIDQIIGDQRQTRPEIKVRASEGGDKELAETMSGLIRNIENISDAETVYDNAYVFTVAGGYGVWRVDNEFNSDDSFEQDIKISEIPNPLQAYCDPSATDICCRDSRYWIITDDVPLEDFETEFPDAEVIDFNQDQTGWWDEDTVRIAEYYRKTFKIKELIQLSDGRVTLKEDVSDILDELKESGIEIVKSRQVKVPEVEWYKISGAEILAGPIVFPWRYIPIVPVFGKRINIEGKYKVKGIVRNAKDPQTSYNYIRSVMTEMALMRPKFTYILTPAMIKGWQTWWDNAHASALPYIMSNVDPDSPSTGGLPKTAEQTPVPIELVQIAQMDAEDIKAGTGFFDASLGQRSNETSGKAILARQREGDVGSYVFIDNLSKAIKFTGELLVDMIPRIYDTERTVRILGEDGAENYVTLNEVVEDEETGEKVILHDLSQGKYDVAVTVGPSYTTLRQESAETLIGLARVDPEILTVARDIIIKNMDIPGSVELESRLRKRMIQQGIVEPSDEEQAELEASQPKEPSEMEQLAIKRFVEEIKKIQSETEKNLASADKLAAEAEGETVENALTVVSGPQ